MKVVDEGMGLDVEGGELVWIFLKSRATGVLVLCIETDENDVVFGVGGLEDLLQPLCDDGMVVGNDGQDAVGVHVDSEDVGAFRLDGDLQTIAAVVVISFIYFSFFLCFTSSLEFSEATL
ncbi:hypothetical protein FF1_031519 [Malus domestica]